MFAKYGILAFITLTVIGKAQILDKKYGVEYGSINYPSGPLERTNISSPPVNLDLPVVHLPEAIPVKEESEEGILALEKKNVSSPPVNLDQPIVRLPEAMPIKEESEELLDKKSIALERMNVSSPPEDLDQPLVLLSEATPAMKGSDELLEKESLDSSAADLRETTTTRLPETTQSTVITSNPLKNTVKLKQ